MKRLLGIFLIAALVLPCYIPASAAGLDPYDKNDMAMFDDMSVGAAKVTGKKVALSRVATDYIVFSGMNFTDSPYAVVIETAIDVGERGTDDTIYVRLDSMDSEPIARVKVTEAEGWYTLVKYTGEITQPIVGVHDVYISQNKPNDLYSIQFLAKIEGAATYSRYSDASRYNDVNDDTPYKREIEILSDLGLVCAYKDNLFYPELPITRGDIACYMAKIYSNNGEIPKFSGEGFFTDVSEDDKSYDSINLLAERGIITVPENRLFRPNDFATVGELAVMSVNFLGYAPIAQKKGGYPNGYLVTASERGIYIPGAYGDYVRRNQAAKMLSDLIDSSYIQWGSEKGTGILNQTQGMQKGRGIVEATMYTSLYSENGVGKNTVSIDGERFKVGNTDASNLIGIKCDYYYIEKKDELTLVAIEPCKSVEQTIINSNNFEIDKVSDNEIRYTDKFGTRARSIKFDNKTALIYNNKACGESMSEIIPVAEDFRGTIRKIDNGDDICVIIIDEYRNIVIQAVDKNNTYFIDDLTNQYIEINSDATFVEKDGISMKLNKLEKGDCGLLYMSRNEGDDRFALLEIYSKKIEGTINSLSENTVEIDGKEYSVAKEQKGLYVGLSGKFCLNKFGEVVYYEKEADEYQKAAWVKAGYNEENGDEIFVRLTTGVEKSEVFTLRENVIIDGIKCKSAEVIINGNDSIKGLAAIKTNSPIIYQLDQDGKIKMIDTIYDGAKNKNDNLHLLNEGQASMKYLFKYSIGFIAGNGIFRYPLSREAKAIGTTKRGNYIDDARNRLSEGSEAYFEAYFYSADRDLKTVDFINLDTDTGEQGEAGDYILIKKVADGLDKYGDICTIVTGYQGSAKYEFTVDDTEEELKDKCKKLKVGDIIRPYERNDGTILDFDVYFHADGSTGAISPSNGFVGNYVMTINMNLGKITKIDGDIIYYKISNSDDVGLCKTSTATIYEIADNSLVMGMTPTNLGVGDIIIPIIQQYGVTKMIVKYDNHELFID